MDTLTQAPFTELLDLLAAADVRATMTPGEVNTPGCWLALETVTPRNLAGTLELACSLYLIAPDADALRAIGTLGDLLAKIVPAVLTPDGPVTTTAVVLPSGPTPLPALRVPVNLHTTGATP